MEYVWIALLLLVNTLGLALIPFGLPGLWLMVSATGVYAWATWPASAGEPSPLHWGTLVGVFVLATVAELIEFFASVVGSKKAGGSNWGSWGGVVGGIAGAILFTPLIPIPIVGTILGGCIGAFAGAAFLEQAGAKRTRGEALKSGGGAAVGRFVGVMTKLGFGIAIWVLVAVAAFVP